MTATATAAYLVRVELTCVFCGCTQTRACLDADGKPCEWIATSARDELAGICSRCAQTTLEELLR